MKKIILASLLASVSTLAVANSDMYVKGSVGYGPSFGVAVGTSAANFAGPQLKDVRVEAGYSFYNITGGSSVHSAGVSALYDIKTIPALNDAKITPYIGASLGAWIVPAKTYTAGSQSITTPTQTSFNGGGVVGFEYAINNQFSVDVSGGYGSAGGGVGGIAVRYKL